MPRAPMQIPKRGGSSIMAFAFATRCCQSALVAWIGRSSAGLMKLAFPRNAFVQFTGMFDVIFKFAVPLR